MKKTIPVFLIICILASVSADDPTWEALFRDISEKFPQSRNITVNALKAQLEEGKSVVLIDTRDAKEFKVSHLPDAINMKEASEILKKYKGTDTCLLLYSSTGYRSAKIANWLTENKMKNTANLQGGIFEWVNSGNSAENSFGKTHFVHPCDEKQGKLLEEKHHSFTEKNIWVPGLPAPLSNVTMVKTADARFNIPIGGWGGLRLIKAKTEPEVFRKFCVSIREKGLNCIRPLWYTPIAANKNDAHWARFDWEAMDKAVAITQEEKIYLLVDYHNWLVHDTMHNHEAEWLEMWGKLIDRYKEYDHLIWEGYNEPQDQCECMKEHFQKWVNLVRAKGSRHLVVVSPFWGDFFQINDPADNWAQKRPYYFTEKNSPNPEKGKAEAEWHISNLKNPNSAASTVKKYGCGFFMTEGGIEGKKKGQDWPGAVAGVQRMVELCEQQEFGWCLWAHSDWADAYNDWAGQLKFKKKYPLITGEFYKPVK